MKHSQKNLQMENNSEIHWVFIAWYPQSRRSEMFSRTLGGNLYCIYYFGQGKRWLAPVKYFLQGLRTFQVLLSERPTAIHVQNPPFISSLVVYFFCLLFGAGYVIDHHSASFSSTWEWALPIQKILARKAMTNIVTNEFWADQVCSWDAETIIMGDAYLDLPPGTDFPVSERFNIAFISTFSPDEPIDQVFKAAENSPAVQVYVTGDARNYRGDILEEKPANVSLTGFLPDNQYVGLLRSVDAVLVLTTRNHTLQLGGCEAVSVGQPLITSDWPFLREFFQEGTIYVENDSESIRAGFETIQNRQQILQEEMKSLRERGRKEWECQLSELQALADQFNQR